MKNQNEDQNQNQNQNKQGRARPLGGPSERLVLPLMKNAEDAMQLCRLEQDTFYLSAFTIQLWLGEAIAGTTAEYAEKKDPRTRALQSGQTWRIFLETTAHHFVREDARKPKYGKPVKPETLDQIHLTDLISDIIRLAEYEDPYAELVRAALRRYLIENGTPFPTERSEQTPTHHSPLLTPHSTLQRLCDWLDSVLHLAHHTDWHLNPEGYDPDPEKRELFMLGRMQRNFDIATDIEKAHWHWHYNDAIKQHADSPKLSALADGVSSTATRVWDYPDVDDAVIALWPLVKRHNWTYADLLKVIRPTLKRPNAYPCDTDQHFVDRCNLLGLRKSGKGRSSKGELVGADVARRLLGIK